MGGSGIGTKAGYGPSGRTPGMPSMAGSYGRKDPSNMTRLFVNGTNPPAPSGTVPSESPQKKKKHNGVGLASVAIVVTGTSRRG